MRGFRVRGNPSSLEPRWQQGHPKLEDSRRARSARAQARRAREAQRQLLQQQEGGAEGQQLLLGQQFADPLGEAPEELDEDHGPAVRGAGPRGGRAALPRRTAPLPVVPWSQAGVAGPPAGGRPLTVVGHRAGGSGGAAGVRGGRAGERGAAPVLGDSHEIHLPGPPAKHAAAWQRADQAVPASLAKPSRGASRRDHE